MILFPDSLLSFGLMIISLLALQIYPSEFGKEKMKEDETSGPRELHNVKLDEEGGALGKLKHLDEKGDGFTIPHCLPYNRRRLNSVNCFLLRRYSPPHSHSA